MEARCEGGANAPISVWNRASTQKGGERAVRKKQTKFALHVLLFST
jgi:hypothetical protein